MVKLGLKPTSSACMRKILAPIEWKVPSHGMACSDPANVATRSRISRAALLVKVTARISCARARPSEIRCAMRARQDASFADACPSENENRPLQRVHSAPLLFVQAVEIGWISRLDAARERPRGSSVARRASGGEAAARLDVCEGCGMNRIMRSQARGRNPKSQSRPDSTQLADAGSP